MSEKKKHTYNSSVLALPPLKLVMGDVPDPDGEESRPIRPFVKNKLDHETRKTLRRLIGRIEQTE